MTFRDLIDDLERLAREDMAHDKAVDLETLLDYCAIADLDGAKDLYLQLLTTHVKK